MYNWVTRRKVVRTEEPNTPDRVAQTVDAIVAKWIPVTAALLACAVTPTRPKLDVRTYDWQPAFTWVRTAVDATVRTYQPATSTELQSYRVAARPSLDVRRYEWTPEYFDVVTRIDAVVRTWAPALRAERASYVTPKAPTLDVRRYDWDVSDTAWISGVLSPGPTVAQTIPAIVRRTLFARTPDRPRLDVRSYEWAPTGAIQPTTDAVVATWSPSYADESSRTSGRGTLDVRGYDWAPTFSLQLSADAAVATWGPAFGDESSRTRAALALDVRRYEWSNGFVSTGNPAAPTPDNGGSGPSGGSGTVGWFQRRVIERTTGPQPVYFATLPVATPPTVDQTWPAFQQSALSARTADRARLDVRGYEWSQPAWITANLPAPTLSVAQTAPAWAGQSAQGYRTAKAPSVDLFRAQAIPDIFGVPDDWITWVPIQDDGGRTRDAARLDVRRYEWTSEEAGWIAATQTPATPATTAQTAPTWTSDHGGLTRDRARLDVRAYEWIESAWIFSSVPASTATIPQQLPALLEAAGLSYRTPARPSLDVRGYDWAPAFTWVQPVTDTGVATLAQSFSAELASTRTADRARLDVRGYIWQPAASGWMLASVAPPATTAQLWPALLENLGTQYQTPARLRLDVRTHEWAPEFTWPARVVDAVVAKWQPVFDAERSSVTADRARLDVRRLTDGVNPPAWWTPEIAVASTTLSTIALTGSAVTTVTLTGSYAPGLDLTGRYSLNIDITGSVE